VTKLSVPTDRRTFLELCAAGALASVLPGSISRALKIPANHRTGSIEDVEHIVILMQENRSFDHYFGTLQGVRGFGDPRAATLPGGDPVWYQPHGEGYVLPFHPDARELGLKFLQDLPHDWTSTHAAWNEGKCDRWVAAKGTTTMAHLSRGDIPFHYSLADAFTICDAYHCSLLGPTDPNRFYLWTGWVGNDGEGGGPVIDNAEAGYRWSTYPERLQAAGVSWKIYQDLGLGLNAEHAWGSGNADAFIGNYADNSLLHFMQYRNAPPGSALFEAARTGTRAAVDGSLFGQLRGDVSAGALPQVSWIVAPEAYTEHPNWPPNYGAWYVSEILDALTSNPEVWAKTAFFLTYDENDGFFDHMAPPTVPASRLQGLSSVDTVNEIYPGNSANPKGPYGMGARVPMIVISPWSKGGWVNSELFDHTSLIRFIETRFAAHGPALRETNITPWRRAVAGDLTSAFNFAAPDAGRIALPSTAGFKPLDHDKQPDYRPLPPAAQALPRQERGVRPARALPYELHVRGEIDFPRQSLTIHFKNSGKAAAVFQVRTVKTPAGPWTYTVGAGAELSDAFTARDDEGAFEFIVHGPNGFLRTFKGSFASGGHANLDVQSRYHGGGITLSLRHQSSAALRVRIADAYGKSAATLDVGARETVDKSWPLDSSFGWYDLTITVDSDAKFHRRIAGHVETGKDSMTDPAIGGL